MASDITGDIPIETFAAMSATMLGAAEVATSELMKGILDRVIVESGNVKIITMGAGPKALLVAMMNPHGGLDIILAEMERATKKIKKIMGGVSLDRTHLLDNSYPNRGVFSRHNVLHVQDFQHGQGAFASNYVQQTSCISERRQIPHDNGGLAIAFEFDVSPLLSPSCFTRDGNAHHRPSMAGPQHGNTVHLLSILEGNYALMSSENL
ncbi:MAG: hypothetical protein QMD78_05080 [Methanocellales archaeon]|nr:hypothetical protein [Methanocellales archaeon]